MEKENNNEEKIVEISQSKLDAMQKAIDRLEFAASKKALARFDSQNAEEKPKEGTIGLWITPEKAEHYVLAWDNMLENEFYETKAGGWREDQVSTLLLGKVGEPKKTTKVKLNYRDWGKKIKPEPVEVLDVITSKDGITYKFLTKHGDELKMDATFFNPGK